MALTSTKVKELHAVVESFTKTGRMWEMGSQLDTITKRLAEVLGETKICINVPYATFNCRGTANAVAEDVKGLMPFSNARKTEDECTTLFYGGLPVRRGNYIPFLSSADVYHISKMEINEDVVNIWLEKGNSYHVFM